MPPCFSVQFHLDVRPNTTRLIVSRPSYPQPNTTKTRSSRMIEHRYSAQVDCNSGIPQPPLVACAKRKCNMATWTSSSWHCHDRRRLDGQQQAANSEERSGAQFHLGESFR